jgi:hypothetical protein
METTINAGISQYFTCTIFPPRIEETGVITIRQCHNPIPSATVQLGSRLHLDSALSLFSAIEMRMAGAVEFLPSLAAKRIAFI